MPLQGESFGLKKLRLVQLGFFPRKAAPSVVKFSIWSNILSWEETLLKIPAQFQDKTLRRISHSLCRGVNWGLFVIIGHHENPPN